jgi:hypothetical protein
MDLISKQAIRNVALKTGLREGTVLDLLRNGWRYTEQIDCLPRWERLGPGIIHVRH